MGLTRAMLSQIEQLLDPIRTQVANVVARAVVSRVDDSKMLQNAQIGALDSEELDDCERFQQYGFSSVPIAGAEAVAVFPSGDRGHPLIVAVDDRRYRVSGLEAGEVAIYNNTGAKVVITKDGDIVATPASGRTIKLGSSTSSDPVALKSELDALKTAIAAWTPVANDGGASLQAVFSAWSTTGSTKAQTE